MVTGVGNDLEWSFLMHRLPREPSAPRLALWRALRRLGAQVLGDGLVALPASPRTVEHLEWLAAGIEESGGTASVWVARPTSGVTSARLARVGRAAIETEYQAVLASTRAVEAGDAVERRRTLRRLRPELRRIGARDFHGAPSAGEARDAVERLAAHELGDTPSATGRGPKVRAKRMEASR